MTAASALVRVLLLAGGGEMDDLIDVRPLQGIADEAKSHQIPQLFRVLILHAKRRSERSHWNGFSTAVITSVDRFVWRLS